jgi:hypothetical protein
MDEQAKPCLSLHVNRTGHASAYGIARDIRINAFLLFRETVHDRWTNPTQNRQLCGNYLRNVATLLLIPDTEPLTQKRKVSNFVSADATRVVSHGAEGSPVIRPSAPAGIGAPAHPAAASISELHESTPHSFGLACIVDSRSVRTGCGGYIGKASCRHDTHLGRSMTTGACKAGTGGKVMQHGFASLQFRAKEQRHHRLGLGFQPKGSLRARAQCRKTRRPPSTSLGRGNASG